MENFKSGEYVLGTKAPSYAHFPRSSYWTQWDCYLSANRPWQQSLHRGWEPLCYLLIWRCICPHINVQNGMGTNVCVGADMTLHCGFIHTQILYWRRCRMFFRFHFTVKNAQLVQTNIVWLLVQSDTCIVCWNYQPKIQTDLFLKPWWYHLMMLSRTHNYS